jgi:hypothetical protein
VAVPVPVTTLVTTIAEGIAADEIVHGGSVDFRSVDVRLSRLPMRNAWRSELVYASDRGSPDRASFVFGVSRHLL